LLRVNPDQELKIGTQKRPLKFDETDLTDNETVVEAETIETTDEVADTLTEEILEMVIEVTTDEVVMIGEAADEMTDEVVMTGEVVDIPEEAQVLTEGATGVQVHTEGDKNW